jgi:sugar/nucleoside kinase (ribokinase family)
MSIVRLIHIKIDPSETETAERIWKTECATLMIAQKGCISEKLLRARERGEFISYSEWETEADIETYTNSAAHKAIVSHTRGIKGAGAWHRQAGLVEVDAPVVDLVDTIGAGDSFQAGLLVALRAMGRIAARPLAEMTADELRRAVAFATKCAAFTCGRRGADPPHHFEIGAATFADELQTDPGDRTATGI